MYITHLHIRYIISSIVSIARMRCRGVGRNTSSGWLYHKYRSLANIANPNLLIALLVP